MIERCVIKMSVIIIVKSSTHFEKVIERSSIGRVIMKMISGGQRKTTYHFTQVHHHLIRRLNGALGAFIDSTRTHKRKNPIIFHPALRHSKKNIL